MRKKILAIVFAAALLVATAVPMVGGGSALANHRGQGNQGPPDMTTICHKPGTPAEKTLELPHQAADNHIAKHSDTLGACS